MRSIFLPVTATSPRDLVERAIQLLVGLALYGIALGFMVRGGIGVAPWDVLALGVAGRTGIGYGTVTVLISGVVLLLWIPLRQRVGIGTLLNALLVGPSADITLLVLPEPPSVWLGAPMFVFGLLLLGAPYGSSARSSRAPSSSSDSSSAGRSAWAPCSSRSGWGR